MALKIYLNASNIFHVLYALILQFLLCPFYCTYVEFHLNTTKAVQAYGVRCTFLFIVVKLLRHHLSCVTDFRNYSVLQKKKKLDGQSWIGCIREVARSNIVRLRSSGWAVLVIRFNHCSPILEEHLALCHFLALSNPSHFRACISEWAILRCSTSEFNWNMDFIWVITLGFNNIYGSIYC